MKKNYSIIILIFLLAFLTVSVKAQYTNADFQVKLYSNPVGSTNKTLVKTYFTNEVKWAATNSSTVTNFTVWIGTPVTLGFDYNNEAWKITIPTNVISGTYQFSIAAFYPVNSLTLVCPEYVTGTYNLVPLPPSNMRVFP